MTQKTFAGNSFARANDEGLNPDNVRFAITGAFYWSFNQDAQAPSGISAAIPGDYKNLGYISSDGVTLNLPGEAQSTSVRAWQDGAIVRVIRTPSEDQPTFQMTFLETKLETIELAFGCRVEQDGEAGYYVINSNVERQHGKAIFDVIDGDAAERYYAPNAVVTAVSAVSFKNTDPTGYQVTVSADYSSEIGGNLAVWDTSLKSASIGGGGTGDGGETQETGAVNIPAQVPLPEAPYPPEAPGSPVAAPVAAFVATVEADADQAVAEIRRDEADALKQAEQVAERVAIHPTGHPVRRQRTRQ